MPTLSKTRFIEGLQCVKRLYLSTYRKDLAQYGEDDLASFDAGIKIGDLATRLFPGGVRVDVDQSQLGLGLEKTRDILSDDSVPAIFEAVLENGGVLVRADILERVSGKEWKIVEVKASTGVKDQHYPDAAIQVHVARGAGLAVRSADLMHINNRYVYDGRNLDLSSLFARSSVTDEVESWQERLPAMLAGQFDVLAGPEPAVEPGSQCSSPYGCPFWNHCTEGKPRRWIYYLPRLGEELQADLRSRGVESIEAIPDDVPLTDLQRRARDCVRSGDPYVAPALKREIGIERYPVHYLDFETINPAIPRFAGTRPYQQVPFQWSVLTVRAKGGTAEEHAYLHQDSQDPRRGLAEKLLEALREPGPVYVYNRGFEAGVLRGLADHLPDLAPGLLDIEARLVDLLPPIRSPYYHADLDGSFSLKAVVPTLLPEMSYAGLDVGDGLQAGIAYLKMITPDCPPDERDRLRRALLTYCGRDTMALRMVHEKLLAVCDTRMRATSF